MPDKDRSKPKGPKKASQNPSSKTPPDKARQEALRLGWRAKPRETSLKVRRRSQDGFLELVHPRSALERADDLEEVEKMLAAGESEIARDELLWLLSGCPDLLRAHRLLGEIALESGDIRLARGHFGYGFEIGLSAILRAGLSSPLPYRLPTNQSFFESAKGLAHCLRELKEPSMAADVARILLACDPSDPLGVGPWADAQTAGNPAVE